MDQTKKRGPGRPRGTPTARNYYDGTLHALLVETLPEQFVTVGRLNVAAVAAASGYSPFALYGWLNRDRLTVEGAKGLLKLDPAEVRLTKVKLLPFLFA